MSGGVRRSAASTQLMDLKVEAGNTPRCAVAVQHPRADRLVERTGGQAQGGLSGRRVFLLDGGAHPLDQGAEPGLHRLVAGVPIQALAVAFDCRLVGRQECRSFKSLRESDFL